MFEPSEHARASETESRSLRLFPATRLSEDFVILAHQRHRCVLSSVGIGPLVSGLCLLASLIAITGCAEKSSSFVPPFPPRSATASLPQSTSKMVIGNARQFNTSVTGSSITPGACRLNSTGTNSSTVPESVDVQAVQLVLTPIRKDTPHLDQLRLPKSVGHPSLPTLARKMQKQGLTFVENRGQFDPQVRFQLRMSGYTLWLTDDGVVFEMVRTKNRHQYPALRIRARWRYS